MVGDVDEKKSPRHYSETISCQGSYITQLTREHYQRNYAPKKVYNIRHLKTTTPKSNREPLHLVRSVAWLVTFAMEC